MTKRLFPENMTSPLRWLMLSRIGIVTFLLGIASFVEIEGMEALSSISASALFKAIVLTYILSISYFFLLKYLRNFTWNIYIQSFCDIVLITGIVYATGGIHSIYSVFYPLVIIYSVLFLGRRGGLIIASLAGIFYGLFVDLEYYGVIYPVFSAPVFNDIQNAAYVFTRIVTHIFSFYFIALLTSFVVEREKKVRTLLAEKQSAFDQLDLLYRSIIESVDTGIMTVNADSRIKSFNQAAEKITGLSFSEIENRPISEIFPHFQPLPQMHNPDGFQEQTGSRFEMIFRKGDERTLTIGGSQSPLRDPKGQMIGNIILFQDLTDIIQMRESLEESRKLAFIGELAAGMAHEIRNPLAAMSGSIQMLSRDHSNSETQQKLMNIILRSKDQLEGFLKDFLLMARPSPGVVEQIDPGGMIREVIDSLQFVPHWPEALQIDMNLPDDTLRLRMNRSECRQVLWNLLLNAVQSMPEGGTLTVATYRRRINEKDGVEILVQDTGCGIERTKLAKVFEPFYTTREMGTGLGLTVVKRILDAYGGTIDLQSDAGQGTVCRVWIPGRAFPKDGNDG